MHSDIEPYYPLIASFITAAVAYIGVTRQVRKNRTAKWIEDFRRDFASYLGDLNDTYIKYDQDKSIRLLKSAHLVNLYLCDNKSYEKKELKEKVFSLQLKVGNGERTNPSIYTTELRQLMLLTEKVILQEQKKI